MASDVVVALGKLAIADDVDCIDDILFQKAHSKRPKLDHEKLKAQLEESYLSPSTTFSTEWLDRLQQ